MIGLLRSALRIVPWFWTLFGRYWTQIGPKFGHLPDHLPDFRLQSSGAWVYRVKTVREEFWHMEMLRHKGEPLLWAEKKRFWPCFRLGEHVRNVPGANV